MSLQLEPQQQEHRLFSSPEISVTDYRCRMACHPIGPEEQLELPLHETPLDHWVRVGDLRRQLSGRGLAVSTSDAHVVQCALDRDALLLSRDAVFRRIAAIAKLRLQSS